MVSGWSSHHWRFSMGIYWFIDIYHRLETVLKSFNGLKKHRRRFAWRREPLKEKYM